MVERIVLKAGCLSAELSPENGGRLSRFTIDRDGVEQDIVPPLGAWTAEPRSWPKQGAYPLFPYSNRIRDAAFSFAGRKISLREHPASPGYALHGPAHLRAWSAEPVSQQQAVLSLDYEPDEDWPWRFQARQEFMLDSGGLAVRLSVRNDADEPTVAGIGWHPYLLCTKEAVITHDAKRLWEVNDVFSATGKSRLFDGASGDDAYLSEWSFAALHHRDGSGVTITADPVFGHLILHRPKGLGYACIEPVSHVADGFNLSASGVAGTGTVVLEPGETLAGSLRLAIL